MNQDQPTTLCGKDAGSRPYWMSPDQYDACPCILFVGHEGDHRCRGHNVQIANVSNSSVTVNRG